MRNFHRSARPVDITSRLNQFEAALEESATAEARAERFATLVQARVGRRLEIDALDRIIIRFLLDAYSEMVRQLRASANDADARLTNVAAVIAEGHRALRTLAKHTDASE